MHVFVTSPAMAEVIALQTLRDDPGSRRRDARRTLRAERRATRRAERAADERALGSAPPRHRLARSFRLAH